MLAGLRRRAVSRPRRARTHAPDAGFTLTEVIVSMMLVSVVMGALTTFYVNSMSIVSYQRGKQTAIQLASSGMEEVRALKASDLTAPPASTSTAAACPTPVPVTGVDLTGMHQWDHDCQSLGIAYHRYWFVGCWQPTSGGPCPQNTGTVEYLRVVVAVTWSDKNCQRSACSYATSTLVSDGTDPLFNPGAGDAPTVTNPGAQTGEVNVPVSVTITASGGAKPLIFSASNLPAGLSMASNGVITGKPTTAGMVRGVTVTATDDRDNTGTASFDWKIVPPPQPANPGPQSSANGSPVSVKLRPVPETGIAPFTWSVKPGPWGSTGLPPGLAINPGTGEISGTPAQTGPAKKVTVVVTDKNGQQGSTSFDWTVVPGLTRLATDRTDWRLEPVLEWLTADGGTGPYTWSAINLPDGVTLRPDGLMFGDLLFGSRYVTTITVTDATGLTNSVTFSWQVKSWLAPSLLGPEITGPADRTDPVGQAVNVPFSAIGHGGQQTWTVTGQPPGVALTNGTLTGTPGQAGTYLVTLKVREPLLLGLEDHATFMFVWTVQ